MVLAQSFPVPSQLCVDITKAGPTFSTCIPRLSLSLAEASTVLVHHLRLSSSNLRLCSVRQPYRRGTYHTCSYAACHESRQSARLHHLALIASATSSTYRGLSLYFLYRKARVCVWMACGRRPSLFPFNAHHPPTPAPSRLHPALSITWPWPTPLLRGRALKIRSRPKSRIPAV